MTATQPPYAIGDTLTYRTISDHEHTLVVTFKGEDAFEGVDPNNGEKFWGYNADIISITPAQPDATATGSDGDSGDAGVMVAPVRTTRQLLPKPIHFQATYRRYHGLLLATDGDRCKVAVCDWIRGEWWTLWTSSERVLPVKRRAVKRLQVAA